MIGCGEGSEQLEKLVSEQIFTEVRTMEILQSITESYVILTSEEIEKWKEDSLGFYQSQKDNSNEVIGNFLRGKSKALLAQICLRFGKVFEQFCGMVVGELVKPEMKD